MDLGLQIQKTNFGIRICILKIQCVPILRENEQIWLFWRKFAQKLAQKLVYGLKFRKQMLK